MSDNSNKSSNAPITNLNKELESVLMSTSTSISASSSSHSQEISPEANASSSKGTESSSNQLVEDGNTEKSKEQQEHSQQTESTENLVAFYKLSERISKSIDELENIIKSTASSVAATKSLAEVKSFLNLSVDSVLLDDAVLAGFKKAVAAILTGNASNLGKSQSDILSNFNNAIDQEVGRLKEAAEKEKKRTQLEKNRSDLVGNLDSYKTELQPCRSEMQTMASKHEELKKSLRDYETAMIEKTPKFQGVINSHQSNIDTDIKALQADEQSLLKENQEIDSLRKEPSTDWSSLIAAFYK